MPGLVYIKTFGCQTNEYDSGKMHDVLEAAHGMVRTEDPAQADVLLVNTCSVREKAQEKVFSLLGEWSLGKMDGFANDRVSTIPGFAKPGPGFAYAYDLGQEWFDWTGLPFVYAVWAVREGIDLGPVAEALTEAKRRGCASTGVIAQREAAPLGLDAGFCRRYLANIIHFDLGPREQAGLQYYYSLACELGLAPRGVNLEFYQAPHAVSS